MVSESKKKVLHIITHLELGGAQKQLLLFFKNIDKEKYEVFFVSGGQGFLKEDFKTSGAIKEIKFIPQLVREINPVLDIIAFFRIYKFIRKEQFDIVHMHSPKASTLGRWAAFIGGVKKVIYTVHGWPFHGHMNRFYFYLYRTIEKITALITQKIVVVSKADMDRGIGNNIASVSKFELIHYGIDIDNFNAVYEKRKNKPFSNNILIISSLKPQKGLCFLIDAAYELVRINPDLKFIITGGGPLKNQVQAKINSLGLADNIFLMGWVKDMTPYFVQTDLIVLSSLWEGLPVVLIESVIAGIPLVTTDTGGQRDLIEDGKQGLVVNPASVQELVSAVANILKGYGYWCKMIANNRKRVDLYYWSQMRMTAEIEKVYSRD